MVNTVQVSYRNLKRNKLRSFLATIGIILGTLAITALLSLGFGLQASIESQFESAGGELIQVTPKSVTPGPPGSSAASTLTEDDLETVQRSQGVEATTGRLFEQTTMTVDDEDIGASLTTLPDDTAGRQLVTTQLDLSIDEGRMLQPGERSSIVVGSSYTEGDNAVSTRDTVDIGGVSFDIVGVLDETGQFIVDNAVFMNEDIARDLFDADDEYDLIIIQPSDEVETVKATVARELRQAREVDVGDEQFQVQTNQGAIQSITSVLAIISGVLAAIGGISLVLGGITIMNTMYTTVLERTKEIGVMKSVGAKRRDITSLFVTEAGLLGFFGGVAGSAAGIGVAQLIAIVARSSLGIGFFEALLAPWLFAAGIGFATITGLISGYAPARRASKKDPVEALRG